MSQANERRARELLYLLNLTFPDAVPTIGRALDEAEARGRPQWRPLDCDRIETFPQSRAYVLIAADWGEGGGPFVARASWDADSLCWYDTDTDGSGDQLEFPPGIVSHWMPFPEPPTPTTEEGYR